MTAVGLAALLIEEVDGFCKTPHFGRNFGANFETVCLVVSGLGDQADFVRFP
jgi:hypothetical protein